MVGASEAFQQMSAVIAGLALNMKGPDRPARPECPAFDKMWLFDRFLAGRKSPEIDLAQQSQRPRSARRF
jgi:hypothetical protein